MEFRIELQNKLVEKCKNTDDLYILCKRSLEDLARTKGLTINEKQFDTIKNKLTFNELIEFVIEEFKKSDEQFIENYKKGFDNSSKQSFNDNKPLLSQTPTDKKLSKDNVTLQVKLPSKTICGQPNTNEFMAESIFEKPKPDSLESSNSSKKPKNLKHK
jgi:hypothetical protein